MESISQQKAWQQFLKLDPELKETIISGQTAEKIISISEKNGVAEETIPVLAQLTGQVLLGFLPPNRFINEIQANLAVDKKTALMIAQDINQAIFQMVKTSLQKLYGLVAEEEKPAQLQFKDQYQPAPPPQKPGEFEMRLLKRKLEKDKEKKAYPPPLRPVKPESVLAKTEPPENLPQEKPQPTDKYRQEPSPEELETPYEKMHSNVPPVPKIEGNVVDLRNIDFEE